MSVTRPTTAPDWATATDFAAGSDPWSGQPNKSAPSGGKVASGYVPGADDVAEEDNFILNNHGAWLNYFQAQLEQVAYGDGSDGAASFDGTTTVAGATLLGGIYTLNRDVYYTTMVVTGSGFVRPSGFAIYAQTSIHVQSGGEVVGDGNLATGTAGGHLNPGPHGCPGAGGAATTATNSPVLRLAGLGGTGVGGGNGSGNSGGFGNQINLGSTTYKFAPYRFGQIPQSSQAG